MSTGHAVQAGTRLAMVDPEEETPTVIGVTRLITLRGPNRPWVLGIQVPLICTFKIPAFQFLCLYTVQKNRFENIPLFRRVCKIAKSDY